MDLEAFVRDVLTPVLDHPEELGVEVKAGGRKMDVLLRARQEDRGRIVGKNGRMISSLRTLCKAAGEKQGLYVNLELVEDEVGAAEASD
jgi:predicted RNA-binding protein YlqC (UPF0109 family)